MRKGKVKWYNGKKCFGFITPDTPNENGNTDDVFVHSSALKEAGIRFLNENDIVEFEEETRNDKLSVTTLKLIQRDEESARLFHERRAERRRRGDDLLSRLLVRGAARTGDDDVHAAVAGPGHVFAEELRRAVGTDDLLLIRNPELVEGLAGG